LAAYFSPLIFGYVVCIILSPVVKLLHRKLHFPRPLASVLSMALMLFIIIFLGTNVVSKVINEGKSFIENSPALINSTVATIRGLEDKLMSYADILPSSVRENSDRLLNEAINTATSLLSTGVKIGSVEVVKFLPNTLFVTLLGLICSFFLLNDREIVERFLIRQLPKPLIKRVIVAKKGVIKAIGGYIKAQCILMCIVAFICCVGLVILHSQYALLLAILISFVDALPVFGSGAIFWPWCIYSVIVGDYRMAIGLAVIDIIVIITRQILEPRILGKQIGLHPIATLMSIFIGLKVFGLFGFIIGPIILVTIKAMQESDLLPKWK
jgi:sporulation integral membrane protein YtvI